MIEFCRLHQWAAFLFQKQGGKAIKESFQERYKKTCQLADAQAEDFAQIVIESFDDLESLGEFVDTLFYMNSISDDEQFASFLGINSKMKCHLKFQYL